MLFLFYIDLNTGDPELTFDVSKFKRPAKDHDEMPIKIKELLRKKPSDRTAEETANVDALLNL